MKKFEYAEIQIISLVDDDILTASPTPVYDDDTGTIGEFDEVKQV